MATYFNNQKVVSVQKEKSDKNNLYAIYNLKALNEALKLSPNAFKLWAYIDSNQNGYTFGLSCRDACAGMAISKPTYLKAVKELIDEGYLQEQEDGTYKFFERAPDEIIVVQINKSFE